MSDEEISHESVKALYSRDLERLRIINMEEDIRYLSKVTNLDEIKCYLERVILKFEKHPADFQNTINFYAKSMIGHQKDHLEMKIDYYSFINQVNGMFPLYSMLVNERGIWGKLQKFFKK